jgi:hypothetical protein
MNVQDFANNYPNEREKVFKVLDSCENSNQLYTALKFFRLLKRKWNQAASNNPTVKLMLLTDENRFIQTWNNKEAGFVHN